MFQPSAEIIADSINSVTGDRLTTFVLTYHRFIHSEFMTYRMFSRNSSSSRAIPVEKMIQQVIDQNVHPLYWGRNQKGMQAKVELDQDKISLSKQAWNSARHSAIYSAKQMASIGVHKQIVNRILEPFSTITVICTATNYQNFFEQRCHPDAQPEIQALAYKMRECYENSKPESLNPGEWHIPFVNHDDGILNLIDYIKISCGRSARVSYLNHDGKRDVDADIKLHDKLINANPPHFSPLEHQAVATAKPGSKFANFSGFKSYRYHLENDLKIN